MIQEAIPANIACSGIKIGNAGEPHNVESHECSLMIPWAARYFRLGVRELGDIDLKELVHWHVREVWLRYVFL